jgi:hypothetical protein
MRARIFLDVYDMQAGHGRGHFREGPPSESTWTTFRRDLVKLGDGVVWHGEPSLGRRRCQGQFTDTCSDQLGRNRMQVREDAKGISLVRGRQQAFWGEVLAIGGETRTPQWLA